MRDELGIVLRTAQTADAAVGGTCERKEKACVWTLVVEYIATADFHTIEPGQSVRPTCWIDEMVACDGRSTWSFAINRSSGGEGQSVIVHRLAPNPVSEVAQRMTDEDLNDLARMLGALRKDILEDATRVAQRVARR